ncbi:MAG: AAA family ATPase [Sinimarinibacterium flocculans]|uniref:AAA family ATPase n=1 Tax=Sinimarinibacterium flocculans TaxID=985250 RepID=UPI003C526F25
MDTVTGVKKLTSLGLYRDFTPKGVTPFGDLNLFYGWNGSGKSTLASVFESLERKALPPRFATSVFSVAVSNGTTIESTDFSACTLNVRTFNQSFIRENIDWDKSVKGILLIAAENIDHKKELDQLQEQNRADAETAQVARNHEERLDNEISTFLTSAARRIKSSLQVIDTKDSRFLNYNKTKLNEFISANSGAVKDPASVLTENDVVIATNAARPDMKPAVSLISLSVDYGLFEKAHQRLTDLLAASATNQAIAKLVENPTLQDWVARGLALHEELRSDHCEYCLSPITDERKKALAGHFNDEFSTFQQRLISADQWLSSQSISAPALPATEALYDEFRDKYRDAAAGLEAVINALNRYVSQWHETLRLKISNQFDCSMTVAKIPQSAVSDLVAAIDGVQSILREHNEKSENFADATRKAKQRLEQHYAARECADFEYFQKVDDLAAARTATREAEAPLAEQREKIQKLQNMLSDAGIGAEQFNKALHLFLGRNDLSLRFDKGSGGYEIIRGAAGAHDGNLSEGEKTAIAFVYFVTKLTEGGNKVSDTIVVIDDPVSSFDSNNLFHAYSFLKKHCEKAGQLLVFTHNFSFYKLVRDWFLTTNRNRKRKGKPERAFFYTVEATLESPRSAKYRDADPSILEYGSEYQYLFGRLYAYHASNALSLDEAFLSANLARKLLETFLTFKFPKKRGDLAGLFTKAQAACTKTPDEVTEKIYRFINRYSHSAQIEMNDDSSENLHGEGSNIVGSIFGWMEELDPVHFQEMKDIVAPPPDPN